MHNVLIPRNTAVDQVNHILTQAILGEEQEDQEWEYYCEGNYGLLTQKAWGSVGGFTSKKVFTYTHAALADNSDGQYQVRVKGNKDTVYTINKMEKLESSVQVNDGVTAALVYDENAALDAAATQEAILSAAVAAVEPEEARSQLTVEYYATATTGAVGDVGRDWAPLEGGKVGLLTYPAISGGTQKVRVTWGGNDEYKGFEKEFAVVMKDRETVQVELNEAPYQAALVFTDQQGINYAATARAIYDAVVKSVDPAVAYEDIQVKYNASLTGTPSDYRDLDNSALLTKKFGAGTWDIQISWGGSREYAPFAVTASVEITDSRLESSVVLKDGVSFTYSKDAEAMKQAVLDSVIDWDNSQLPDRDTLSTADFTFTYNATKMVEGISTGTKEYVPFEGKDALVGNYPQIGAGEQQIRVSYNGSAEYRPSQETDGTVTINKANVKVSVKSASMYVSQAAKGLDLVTTDPQDDFDIYVVYAGITSSVTTGVSLQLPERYTNGTLLKAIDAALNALGQPTLSELMANGTTVGELRKLLSSSEIIDALEKVGIDTGMAGQLIQVIDKLPSIADDVRISFGAPRQAGIYAVTAVTDNANYNTGVGVGALVLKAEKATLVWNQDFGKKITQAQAQETDFGATLTVDGAAVDQSSVHVLYTGFTSKWKPYTSTTTAPTEPGVYTMTVVVLGGNYLAAPLTRTFQITK